MKSTGISNGCRFKIAFLMLAAAGLFCGSRAATAADLPIKAPREVVVPDYDWSGFYVGAHAGRAWGRNRFDDPTASISDAANPFIISSAGPIFGGQIGINWQVGHFVLGAEADVDWASLRGNFTFDPVTTVSATSTNIRSLATGDVRFGVAMGQWLGYLKGGVAWADVDFSATTAASSNPNIVTVTQQRTGLTGGVGLEVAFWQNVSAKIEYDYLVFGQQTVAFFTPANPLDVNQQVQVVKAGFNVRFGGGATTTRY
jgi:outer membrane immunogenic protein